jgi:hypothetical protein
VVWRCIAECVGVLPWGDGMLKNGFMVECWLGHVQAFHEQIKLGQNIIGIDMNIQTIHLPSVSGFPWINFINKNTDFKGENRHFHT